jgi:protein gp37
MAERTAIEWTATVHPDGRVTPGSSWNPIRGEGGGWACVKTSPACSACYAEKLNLLRGNGRPYLPGRHAPPVLDERALRLPSSWRTPRRIFVCSMTDLFWEAVPDAWIARVLGVALAAPRHTYLLLTKRPARMRRFFEAWLAEQGLVAVPGHIWVGATVENQTMAGRRLPELLAVPAAVRFVSAEPLLGPLDLRDWLGRRGGDPTAPAVRWVITGGESGGTRARRLVERAAGAHRAPGRQYGRGAHWRLKPHAAAWLRALRDQCLEAGAAFLLKQLGGPTPKAAGRALDGLVWHQYPDESGFVRPAGEGA